MSESFYCMDCQHTGPLDVHLRCDVCGSDSVTIAISLASGGFGVSGDHEWTEWARRAVEQATQEKK